MFTAAQLRAARGLLDWTRSDLAKAANISPETIKNIEHGTFRPQENTAEAIIRAFSMYDVQFTESDGVQLRKDTVIRSEGVEGFKRFMDDVFTAAQMPCSATDGDKPLCATSIGDNNFAQYLGDYFTMHVRRMNGIKNFKMRILHREKPTTTIADETAGSYREYRLRSADDNANASFYVYADKLSIINFDQAFNPPQIVTISSSLVAKAYREQFEAMWRSAQPMKN